MGIFRHILPYYRPYRGLVVAGLVFVLLANAFKVAGPWILRDAINALEEDINPSALWTSAALILGVAVLSGVFRFLMRRTVIGVSRHIEYDLRQDLFRHLLEQEPAFYDRSRIGDLMARLTSDIERVRMVIGPSLMYAVNTISGLAFGFTLMILISPLLTLFVFVIVPIVTLAVFIVGKKIHRASMQTQEAFSDISSLVQENLAGIRVVQAFRQEEHQARSFERESTRYFRASYRAGMLQGIFFPLLMLIFGLAVAVILLVGGYFIIEGRLRIGDFVAFVSYLMILTWPMISIGWVVGLIQRGAASLERLMALFNRRPELADPDRPEVPGEVKGEVRFEKVEFTYPLSSQPALRGISLHVPAGKTLGIVGRIGSGKSSLLSLLTRLYDPDRGGIFIDGLSIHRMRRSDLRALFGIVPQDPILFSTSLMENITLGKRDYRESDIEQALEISRLVQDLPVFPAGLATEVGERGITLSGGQKQRVAIARAVIRKPPVIILDDALSAVDANTEELIIRNLRRYLTNRTAIIVTHRVSTVIDADEIIVMDQGGIAERGTHHVLMEKKGLYVDLFQRQQVARELEEVE